MNSFVDTLVPIGIVVVLPIIIVMMEMRRRKHEVDRKTEIMMKAIEKGVDIDPTLFQMPEQPKRVKTVKDKLIGRLTTACITGGIGLLAGIVSTITLIKGGFFDYDYPVALIFLIPCAILLAVGCAFLISYFVGRKLWAKELAEMDAAPAQTPDEQ